MVLDLREYSKTDETFEQIFTECKKVSLIDRPRCFYLYQFAKQCIHIAGDIAELGVYKGGSAYLIASVFRECGKEIHLFDTFTGIPAINPEHDGVHVGAFSNSYENTASFLMAFPNIVYHIGIFPETMDLTENLCFVHVDADVYPSIMAACEKFYPLLSSSGLMIFDDYGFSSCPGTKVAVDSFFAKKPEYPIYLSGGQAIVIKH